MAAFAGYCAMKNDGYESIEDYDVKMFRKTMFIALYSISALIVLLPLVFTELGVDRPVYIKIYQDITWQNVLDYNNQETGFMLINFILRNIFGPCKYIPLVFFYGLMVFNVYYVMYKERKNISIPLAIFIFVVVYGIQSINLMRIAVAGSILLMATYKLHHGHKWKSFICFLFAISIHYSCLLFALIYVIVWYYNLFKDKFSTKTYVLLVVFAACLVLFVLLIPVIKDLPIIDRYENYLKDIELSNIGLLQPTLYLPLIVLSLYFVYWYNDVDMETTIISGLIVALFFGMIGYFVIIIGRSYFLFMWPFVIGIPYMYKKLGDRYKECYNNTTLLMKNEHLIYHQTLRLMLVVYVLFRFVIYMTGYIELDGIGVL